MLELKFSILNLESIEQLLQIFITIYNNIIYIQEFIGFDAIFVGGLILFSIYVIDIISLLIHPMNAGKEALKKAGKILTSLGTGASIYTGGKEILKDVKKTQENNNANTSNNNGNSNTNNSSSSKK